MTDFDKLSPMKKARLNRERRIEDIQAHFEQKMHDLLLWKEREIYHIDCLYIVEAVAANPPKLIKVDHGMVLFA